VTLSARGGAFELVAVIGSRPYETDTPGQPNAVLDEKGTNYMKRIIIGAVVASALITVPVVMAVGGSDGNTLTATMVVKALDSTGASFTVTNDAAHVLDKNSGNALTTNGLAVKVSCATSTDAVLIPAPSYTGGSTPATDPKFLSCTDNLKVPAPPTAPTIAPAGTCTALPCAEAVGTAGAWTSTYTDATDVGGEVLGAGDSIAVQGPAHDVISISSAAKECEIQGNPNGTDAPATGSYNDSSGSESISGASLSFTIIQNPKFPVAKHYPACALVGDTGTASFTGTYQLSPKLADS